MVLQGRVQARHKALHPALVLKRRAHKFEDLQLRFDKFGQQVLTTRVERLVYLRGLLRALGPESSFHRGFSIARTADGTNVTSATALQPGERLRTLFVDGEMTSVVDGRLP